MMHQPAQNQSGCPDASMQTPDTLLIDLPHADPEEVYFTIIKCLVQMSTQHWDLMKEGLVSGAAMTVLASSCMDMIQVFAEAILDVVMPQVYRYMTTYGTFSPSVLGLTEGRIHSYLGDSIEQALAKALKIKVQNFEATKKFYQLLLRHISKAVNSVLALTTQTSTLVSRLPVVFVSGCVTSTGELLDIVCQFATILTGALEAQPHAITEAQWSLNASFEPVRVLSPIFYFNSRKDLKKMVKAYISRMVNILKSAQMPNCVTSSSDHIGVCIRVGTNTQMVNVEDRDSDRQESAMSSCCGSDVIPGAVPDRDETESHSESCPFSSVTVIADHESGANEMESIKTIAEELVEAFSAEDMQGSVQGHSSQQSVHRGLVVKDTVKLRELTDRIFNVIMSGHDYQIPSVPDGTRMCNTVTYRKLRGERLTDPGTIAHALYLRTEEVVTRCAMQVLLWSQVYSEQSNYSTPNVFAELPDFADLIFVPGNMGGDRLEVVEGSTTSFSSLSSGSPYSNITFFVESEPLEMTQPQMLGGIVPSFLLTLLVREMFTVIGITNNDTMLGLAKKATEQLQDLEPQLYNHLHVSLRGRSYKDIYQAAISDLLLEFSSLQELQEAVRSGDASFEEAIMRALRKQLTIPTSLVPNGNAAKKPTCSFFKKLRKLCCYKKGSGKVAPVIPLTMDQDSNELQEHLSEEEPLKDEPKQRQCPPTSRIAGSIRHMCSSSKKMFSSIAKALGRPCTACLGQKSQSSISTEEAMD